MLQTKNKPKVIVATNQYLIRIGIQAIIQNIGIEPIFIHIKNFNDFEIHNYDNNDYLIVHTELLLKPITQHIRELSKSFKGKILFIGNNQLMQLNIPNILYLSDTKYKTLEKLQHFFSKIKSEELATENNVLSTREIEILKEVALGYSNKEIADRLFISINTVITHRKNITDKLGIKTISGLTVYALMNNIIKTNDVTI